MAIITPVAADFTAYNGPGGALGASGWFIMATSQYGDTQWHGYTRPYAGQSKIRIWAPTQYNYSPGSAYGQYALGFVRGSAMVCLTFGTWLDGGARFGERWTLPSTFSAFTGSTSNAIASSWQGFLNYHTYNAFELRLAGGVISFWGSPGYPQSDPPFVTAGTDENVATWLGGTPTAWGVFARNTAGATNVQPSHGMLFRGYEEIP